MSARVTLAVSQMRCWGDYEDVPGGEVRADGRDRRALIGYGSYAPSKARSRYLPVIADPHTPCWLCEPGYVCAFHRED